MNYELAKKLESAGYPQELKDGLYEGDFDGTVYFPTLSELIEACGERFAALNFYPEAPNHEQWESSSERKWVMEVGALNPQHDLVVYGSTPEEAVARLWLALNQVEV